MDTREDHGSYYPGGEKIIPIREVSGNVKKVNGIAPDAAGNVQVPTDDTDAVRFTAQSLTDAQKAQARSNIGAIASAPVASVNGQTGAVVLNGDNINYAVGTTLNAQIDAIGGAAADAGTAAESAAGEIDAHTRDTSNPHGVTAAQVGALTASDVDTTLNPSSTNPLANSAVAASLPMNLRWANAEMSEDDGWYVIHAKNHDIVNVIMTPNMISQSVDNTIDIRVPVMSYNPTSATNCGYEGMIRLTLAGTLTDQPVLLFEDENFMGSFFLMEGSVTEFVGGKSYLILIFAKPTNASANHGVYNIKIVEDGSVAV